MNSHITMLKAALAKAVAWKVIPPHPLEDVKPIKADNTGRVRYLTPAEEQRLRKALTARDASRAARREQANRWRLERGYAEWPADASDHLTSIVLVALNTGQRKGEIFGLHWRDIDLAGAQLTVRGEGAKSGQTRYVPLNTEVLEVLRAWRTTQPADADVVFPGEDGTPLIDIKKAWAPVVKAAKLSVHIPRSAAHVREQVGDGGGGSQHGSRAARARRSQDDAARTRIWRPSTKPRPWRSWC